MSAPCECSKGHRYMSSDVPGEYFDLGEPPCPTCALEWWRERAERLMDLQRARLVPGDVLIVRYEQHLPAREQEHILSVVQRQFPDNKILILVGGAELSVIEAQE